MVSPETTIQTKTKTTSEVSIEADYDDVDVDEESFISISSGSSYDKDEMDLGPEFEFLSVNNGLEGGNNTMLTADELFFEGKLLPFWQITDASQKLSKIKLKTSVEEYDNNVKNNGIVLGRDEKEPRIWYVDDDPSPKPPNCTVLWKELLRLKKQKGNSTLSPSSSSSSSSSSGSSLGEAVVVEETEKEKRSKKGLERTKSATFRIRPMVNVPICANTGKITSLPPLFPIRKSKIRVKSNS